MCNCGKPKPKPASGGKASFTLQDTSGRVQTFGSRLEAQAANVREQQGTGIVKP